MANEIRATYDTGATLYALIFNTAGQVWDLTLGGGSWVAYAAADIDRYDIVLSEIYSPCLFFCDCSQFLYLVR